MGSESFGPEDYKATERVRRLKDMRVGETYIWRTIRGSHDNIWRIISLKPFVGIHPYWPGAVEVQIYWNPDHKGHWYYTGDPLEHFVRTVRQEDGEKRHRNRTTG